MKYISEINIKEYLTQVDLKLNLLEVKGESVSYLFYARSMLQELYKGIEEEVEEEKKKEGQ